MSGFPVGRFPPGSIDTEKLTGLGKSNIIEIIQNNHISPSIHLHSQLSR